MNTPLPPAEPVDWQADATPVSPRFGQAYRSRSGGLAQAHTVFLGGCGLPRGWRGRSGFTVLETGFGLGLNFLATWAAWEADPERSARLSFVSVEGFPVAAQDIARSAMQAGSLPGSSPLPAMARDLAVAWEGRVEGVQTWSFAGGRVDLTLALGDVRDMLSCLSCEVDAVFLDGFSPAVNPDMWSEPVLRAVARTCRPGARLSSYSTARPLRERLQQLGFDVRRCPGLPPKRHRLEATWTGPA